MHFLPLSLSLSDLVVAIVSSQSAREQKGDVSFVLWVLRVWDMEEAEKELERRSKFLNSLIQQKKKAAIESEHEHESSLKVDVRACDMPLPLQNRAFQCARLYLESMPPANKLDSKRLALALKKVTFIYFLSLLGKFSFSKICFWCLILGI